MRSTQSPAMCMRSNWILLVVPMGALAGLLVALLVSCLMPKTYESEAIFEVLQREPAPFLESMIRRPSMNTNCFPMEFDKIKSRHNLEQVIKNLDLTRRWKVDEETALQLLRRIVIRENLTGTDLISVRVRHTNRFDARDIAMDLVKSYKEWRGELVKRDAEETLEKLVEAIRDQEVKVEERRMILVAVERTMKKNIVINGTETLLHIPEPREYTDAKADYAIAEKLLMNMELVKISAKTSALFYDDVAIHEFPEVANTPVSPKVTLNLVFGAALGVLLSPLMALPVIRGLKRQGHGPCLHADGGIPMCLRKSREK